MSAPNQRQAMNVVIPRADLLAIPHAANDLMQTHAELPPADDGPCVTEWSCVGMKHEAREDGFAIDWISVSLTKHGGRGFCCYRLAGCPPRNTDAITSLSPKADVRPPNQEAMSELKPKRYLPPQPTRKP